jgi:hypothetical protein
VIVCYGMQNVRGIVSGRYVPAQNRWASNFLDAIVTVGGLRYRTAGALGQGRMHLAAGQAA